MWLFCPHFHIVCALGSSHSFIDVSLKMMDKVLWEYYSVFQVSLQFFFYEYQEQGETSSQDFLVNSSAIFKEFVSIFLCLYSVLYRSSSNSVLWCLQNITLFVWNTLCKSVVKNGFKMTVFIILIRKTLVDKRNPYG